MWLLRTIREATRWAGEDDAPPAVLLASPPEEWYGDYKGVLTDGYMRQQAARDLMHKRAGHSSPRAVAREGHMADPPKPQPSCRHHSLLSRLSSPPMIMLTWHSDTVITLLQPRQAPSFKLYGRKRSPAQRLTSMPPNPNARGPR